MATDSTFRTCVAGFRGPNFYGAFTLVSAKIDLEFFHPRGCIMKTSIVAAHAREVLDSCGSPT
jgi:hypothetical protein